MSLEPQRGIHEKEITVGHELPQLVKPPIERIQLVRYAGASLDFNRIHVEEGFAQAAGYKSVFAHGMLIMGFLGQLVSDWAGPKAVVRIGCRFKAITWPSDVITCSGKVTEMTTPRRTPGGSRDESDEPEW